MFEFKQFSINDDQSSMKVGTDAVLLGTLAQPIPNSSCDRILDIGTGCGVIALMLAQRFTHATIDAIDIDLESIVQAKNNFEQSPWLKRLNAIHTRIQDYSSEKYHLIVSNPPFFENSLKAPNKQRNLARHTDALSIEDLITHITRLLSPIGCFWGILPYSTAKIAIKLAKLNRLNCNQEIHIHNTEITEVKRTIFKLSYAPQQEQEIHQYIRNQDNTYSIWYKELTHNFYTHLK